MSNFLCPCCSYPLLGYVRHGTLRWFCPRCHQEMPYGTVETTHLSQASVLENHQLQPVGEEPVSPSRQVMAPVESKPMAMAKPISERFSDQFPALLHETVEGVRKILRADRVILCRTTRKWEATVVAESHAPGRSSMLKCRLGRFFGTEEILQFQEGKLQAIADLNSMDLDRCPTKILECFFEVSAKLVVPVRLEEMQGLSLWGLLAVHQCYTARSWSQREIDTTLLLAQQLARSLERDRRYCELQAAHEALRETAFIHQEQLFRPLAKPDLEPQETSNISRSPSPAVTASPEELLKSYVAYYLSRGKGIMSPHQGSLGFPGAVYGYEGYRFEFENFWRRLQERSDFRRLYLMGDMRCFENFLEGSYTVLECQRCHLPIPSRYGRVYEGPECTLCDDCPTKWADSERSNGTTRVLAVGEAPLQLRETQRLFRQNRYEVQFVETPEEALSQSLGTSLDVVTLQGDLSEAQGRCWASQLREDSRFAKLPILGLSDRAGYGLPWMGHPLELQHYLLPPLSGEHLVRYLRRRREQTPLLYWFPR
ncbi:MAG: GAF domain-containing protein [Sodalinema sp.]|uniref:GAF domain-containing protein n=1 Tax=Sodalinema sp. TaxID=3080550 RepID=UPI0011FDBCBF|nr:MAG: GAF domain-containing protein [Phormidium sp. SL48-SHIP]